MPANLVKPGQEQTWARAKATVQAQYPDLDEGDRFWALVTTIFTNMTKAERIVPGPPIDEAVFADAARRQKLRTGPPPKGMKRIHTVPGPEEDPQDVKEVRARVSKAEPLDPTLHHVKLTRSTPGGQWSWFVTNPQGGGSGTNAGSGVSLGGAHRQAVSRHTGLPAGAKYHLTVGGKYRGVVTRGQEAWASWSKSEAPKATDVSCDQCGLVVSRYRRPAAKPMAERALTTHIQARHPKKTMKKAKDRIPGGLADTKNPKDFDPEALAAGITVELEHTNDRAIAAEIARDHLTEDPHYYVKLKRMEKAKVPSRAGWGTPRPKKMLVSCPHCQQQIGYAQSMASSIVAGTWLREHIATRHPEQVQKARRARHPRPARRLSLTRRVALRRRRGRRAYKSVVLTLGPAHVQAVAHQIAEAKMMVKGDGGCPACGGDLTPLGTLGNRVHSRCRQCGMDSSHVERRGRTPRPRKPSTFTPGRGPNVGSGSPLHGPSESEGPMHKSTRSWGTTSEPTKTYKIMRFAQNKPARTVQRGLTLEQAQAHCQRPDTSGFSHPNPRKRGTWFHGYQEEKSEGRWVVPIVARIEKAGLGRRHFARVAHEISQIPDEAERTAVHGHFAKLFSVANPRFDRHRFRSASWGQMAQTTTRTGRQVEQWRDRPDRQRRTVTGSRLPKEYGRYGGANDETPEFRATVSAHVARIGGGGQAPIHGPGRAWQKLRDAAVQATTKSEIEDAPDEIRKAIFADRAQKVRLRRMDEIAAQHRGHFFSPKAMKFFGSRVGGVGYEGAGGTYFVTSERHPAGAEGDRPLWNRRYTVRQFHEGDIQTMGLFGGHGRRGEAHREAQRLAASGVKKSEIAKAGERLAWKRPAKPGAVCKTCGKPTGYERIVTGQHEPRDHDSGWTPTCDAHAQKGTVTQKAEDELLSTADRLLAKAHAREIVVLPKGAGGTIQRFRLRDGVDRATTVAQLEAAGHRVVERTG